MATVPIVTEVTKAQLDALVAANGLNEGLQYKVTDKNWLVTATSSNTYIIDSTTPYLSARLYVLQISGEAPVITLFENNIGDLTYVKEFDGKIAIMSDSLFTENKTFIMNQHFMNHYESSDLIMVNAFWADSSTIVVRAINYVAGEFDIYPAIDCIIEIRVYL